MTGAERPRPGLPRSSRLSVALSPAAVPASAEVPDHLSSQGPCPPLDPTVNVGDASPSRTSTSRSSPTTTSCGSCCPRLGLGHRRDDLGLRPEAGRHVPRLARSAVDGPCAERVRRYRPRREGCLRPSPRQAWSTSVRIRTERPDALLLHQLTQVLIARGSTREEIELTPLGTGPYRVVRWEKGGSLDLAAVRLEESAPGAPRSVRFVAPRGGDAAILGLSSGGWTSRPPTAVLAGRARLPPPRTKGSRSSSSDRHAPAARTTNPPPTCGSSRRGLALGRRSRAVGRRAAGVRAVPRAAFGHDPSLVSLPFDPAAALRLMSGGFPRGFSTSSPSDNRPRRWPASSPGCWAGGNRVSRGPPWGAAGGPGAREFPLYLMRWVRPPATYVLPHTVASPGPNRGTQPRLLEPARRLPVETPTTFNASVRRRLSSAWKARPGGAVRPSPAAGHLGRRAPRHVDAASQAAPGRRGDFVRYDRPTDVSGAAS
jgi:hypothetical protein